VFAYKASMNAPVSLVQTRSLAFGALPNFGSNEIIIANASVRGDENNRAFDGWMDNIRIFGSKTDASGSLSREQLEWLRTKDVLNLPDRSRLRIVGGRNQVTVSWPLYPGGFRLEYNSSPLNPLGWQSIGFAPTVQNGEYRITISTPDTRFFRLKR
jgi:hypothetical protein